MARVVRAAVVALLAGGLCLAGCGEPGTRVDKGAPPDPPAATVPAPTSTMAGDSAPLDGSAIAEVVHRYATLNLSADSITPSVAATYRIGSLPQAHQLLTGPEPQVDPRLSAGSPVATIASVAPPPSPQPSTAASELPVTAVFLRGRFEFSMSKGLTNYHPRGDELILFLQDARDDVPPIVGQALGTLKSGQSDSEARFAAVAPRVDVPL